jgi:hypothetical protein
MHTDKTKNDEQCNSGGMAKLSFCSSLFAFIRVHPCNPRLKNPVSSGRFGMRRAVQAIVEQSSQHDVLFESDWPILR